MSKLTAVVIGSGSGGKTVAQELARRGVQVTIVEKGRVGGECPYTACVPSKAMLLAGRSGLSWDDAVAKREEIVDGRDDHASVEALAQDGVRLRRGHARLAGRKRVEVGEQTLISDVVILAPGSRPAIPPVEGLDDVPTWTSDQALSTDTRPASLAVLGGGAVGCELAQSFAAFGTEVTLIETAEHLLPSEPAFVGETLAKSLTKDGVTVRTGVTATKAEKSEAGATLHLDDGSTVTVERVLIAGGRTANLEDVGLDTVGITPDGRLATDPRGHVSGTSGGDDWLYAVGDATSASSYTHSANQQARAVAGNITGDAKDVDLTGTPRVVFTDPAVWCTGDFDEAVRTGGVDLADVERGGILGTVTGSDVPGRLELGVDDGGRVVAVAAIGPDADAWAGELGLAVHLRVRAEDLRDAQHGFLTWSEAITAALDALD